MKSVNSARRRFFWKAGAALSAPLAVVAPNASTAEGPALEARLAMLEDLNAIRGVNLAYVRHVNAGAHREAAALFADPAQARLAGIRALAADPLGGDDDAIELSADGTAATARSHCTLTTETPIEPSCPLVEMARAQGGGVTKRSERGLLESAYVKVDGVWMIERWAFRAT